jgi:hypothetical protein
MSLTGEGADYYLVVRLALVTTGAIALTQSGSMLYLRWSLGSDEVRDGVPFLLCSLAQSVAWDQLLLLLLRSLGLVGDGAAARALQSAAAACLYALTPFAYLFHEAVGVGHFWGAAGFAGRALEAATLLGLLFLLIQGFTSVLADLLADDGSAASARTAAFEAASAADVAGSSAGVAAVATWWWPSKDNPAHTLLQAALAYLGLALLLVTVPRGAVLLICDRIGAAELLGGRGGRAARPAPLPAAFLSPTRATDFTSQLGNGGTPPSPRSGGSEEDSSSPPPSTSEGKPVAVSDPPTGALARAADDFEGDSRRPPMSGHGSANASLSNGANAGGNDGRGESGGGGGGRSLRRRDQGGAPSPVKAKGASSEAAASSPAPTSNGRPDHPASASLLAQPLPTRRSAAIAALWASPKLIVQYVAATLWVWMLVAATSQLLAHAGHLLHGTPPPPPPPSVAYYASWGEWLFGWRQPTEDAEPELGTSSLILPFICAAAAGHHFACRYRLLEPWRRRPASLQSALLQTAALQLQAAAVPVGAHALGLVPRSLATASTTLPLCGPLGAAAFCVLFLGANAVAAALWLQRR